MRKTMLGLLFCLGMTAPITASSQTTACKQANDTSTRIISAVKSIMTQTNKVRLRANLPLTPLSDISLITDENVCIQARDAYNAYTYSSNPSPPNPLPAFQFYVLRVGTYFATFDPDDRAGEWHIIDFFDSTWHHVGTMLPF